MEKSKKSPSAAKLQVIAIGTGTCSNGHPGANGRRPPAFLIIANGLHILFDCGEGARYALEENGVDFGRVTHIAVTHGHPDHSVLPQFIQSKFCRRFFNKKKIVPGMDELSIYLPKRLQKRFMQVWRWYVPENPKFWEDFKPEMYGLKHGAAHVLAPGIVLKSYDNYHGFGKHPSMCFFLETPWGSVAYTGDCGYTGNLAQFFFNADLLIADRSADVGHEYTQGYGHMGPRQCGTLAREAKVKTLWMTHYTGLDPSKALLAEVKASGFKGKAIVAKDNLKWGV